MLFKDAIVNPPLLEMTGITKRFGGVTALHGVDFAIASGEVVGLIGENGAGKSTLMKVLGGLHQLDAGAIRMDGKAVSISSVAEATQLGIAFVHQELSVFANLDIAGNVFLGREPRRAGVLLDRARMPTWRIWAENAPFDLKDELKARGYRWNGEANSKPRAWYIDVADAEREVELVYLQTQVYRREITLPMSRIDAYSRFSDRI